MIQPPVGPSAVGPSNAERTGVVMYVLEGTPSMVQKRRENAYQKMHDACDGPYHIVNETDRVELTTAPNLDTYHAWYIRFACD